MELAPGSTLTVRTRGGRVGKLTVPPAGTHRYTHLRYAVESGDIAVLGVEGEEVGSTEAPDDLEPEEAEAQAPDLAELRAEYEDLAGEKANHRWKAPRLQQEIAALLADDEDE